MRGGWSLGAARATPSHHIIGTSRNIMSGVWAASLDQVDPQDIWRKDRDHFLHPWTHFDSFKKDGSLVRARGEGAYVYDISGKRYLDGIGGLWCINMGYGREEIIQAMVDQARRLVYFSPFVDTTNVPAAELAAKLAALAPGALNHVFFTCGGSTANDTAVRLIQYYQSRRDKKSKRHVIARTGGYHGSTYLTGSISGKPGDRSPHLEFIQDWVHHVSAPNVYRRPKGMSVAAFCDHLVKELEDKILEIGPENVSCFFAEPVLGAGGVMVPPEGYHRKTLGACIFSDAIHEVISAADPDSWFTNGYTYSGHPIACAAGLANIALMEREDICGHVRKVGPYLEAKLNELRDLPIVGDVRGHRFMMCVENVADRTTGELFPEDVDIGRRISRHCESLGLIVRPIGPLNVISPPLILTKAQVDELAGLLRQGIEATMVDLRMEGLLRA